MTMFTRTDKSGDQLATPKMPEQNEVQKSESAQSSATTRERVSPQAASAPRRTHELAPSVISKALRITGQLESSEDIRIDGTIEGDVRGQSVTVGSGATINGTVSGDAVELSGTVNGKIEAKKVILTSTARMSGDVIHQDIQIESGAYIDGNCRPGFGKNEDKNVHSLRATTASLQEKETTKKASNGGTKAEFGTV